jgi:hypothetical protein
LAKQRYEGVATWLTAAEDPALRALSIYVQGSTALGTTVKPIRRNEHDVDLVAFIPGLAPAAIPAAVLRLIGERLRASGHYAPLLEAKTRCWRLNYANEFHLDITPSILNPACLQGGELVPDRQLQAWSVSNPKGYRALFDHRAALRPRLRFFEAAGHGVRAGIEPFPISRGSKGLLRRVVQILKRHRDQFFLTRDAAVAPISVILTTLASRSYEYCVQNHVYDDEFGLLCAVIQHMPRFIDTTAVPGQWFVWNETTTGENFAERWNDDPQRARAFYSWHTRALADIAALESIDGLDRLTESLGDAFGTGPAAQALRQLTERVSQARTAGRLSVAPAIGLYVGREPRSTPVPSNTFFGR